MARALAAGAVVFGTLIGAGQAGAAMLASDTAADAVYSNGWDAGDNGGSGFGAWSFSTGNRFVGNSQNNGGSDGNINTADRAWGQYDGQVATRPFSGALSVGQRVSVSFDNGYLDSGNVAGVTLADATGTAGVSFRFTGGDGQYRLVDAGGTTGTGLSFTSAGLEISFDLTSATTYSISVTRKLNNQVFTTTGTLATTSPIDRIQIISAGDTPGGSGDVFSNNLSITEVPEPGALSLVAGAALIGLRRRRRD